MSDENIKLISIHPFTSSQTKLTKNYKYNGIDIHSGILVSIAEKGLCFYETSEYEKNCENTTLRPNKLVENNFFLKISDQNEYSWLEYNCDGSLLIAAMLLSDQSLSYIKIIDVAKTINNFEETLFCQYKPHRTCTLNDLKWHPNDKSSFLMILNDVVHLCTTKENEVMVINSKPNAFCVSWSPKGKQFSVVMKNETTGRYILNQYDNLMAEKRSTDIGDASAEFKVPFGLVPVDLCWYSTFHCIIGFRGPNQTSEQFKIFPCNFAIKTSKMQILCESMSSNDCINPSPGPGARLHSLHIPEWNAIVLANNSAENAVIYEYDANNDLSILATYCLPIGSNVIGLGCDFTAIKKFTNNDLHPMLLLLLSNGHCFGIYMQHNTKKIDRVFGKMKVPRANTNRISAITNSVETISPSTPVPVNGQNGHCVVSEKSANINLFGIAPRNPPVTSNLFGTSTGIPVSSSLGTTKPEESGRTSLFGNSNPQKSLQTNLFEKTNTEESAKTSSFETPKSQEPFKINLFGTHKTEEPPKTSIFSAAKSQEQSMTNIFGVPQSKEPSKTNLFGIPKPGTSLFAAPKPEGSALINQVGVINSEERSKASLFGTGKTEDLPKTNLFDSTKTEGAPKTNLFGVPKSETAQITNIFGTARQENTARTNTIASANSEISKINLFGTQSRENFATASIFSVPRQEHPSAFQASSRPDAAISQNQVELTKSNTQETITNQENLAQVNKQNIFLNAGQKYVPKPTTTGLEPSKSNPPGAAHSHMATKGPLKEESQNVKPLEDHRLTSLPRNTVSDTKSPLAMPSTKALENKPKDHKEKSDVIKSIPPSMANKKASGDCENPDKLTVDLRKEKQVSKSLVATDVRSTVAFDQFLPEALKSMRERFHSIKINTEGLISKSKNFFSSDLMVETVPKMYQDVEGFYGSVKNIDMSNKDSMVKSKSVFQDINITMEFTTRFRAAIIDYKNHNKNPKPTPNPLLKKTSLNLDELMKKANLHLKELEDELDDIENTRNTNCNSASTSKLIENITKAIHTNEMSISIERSKIDLLKEHLQNSNVNIEKNSGIQKKIMGYTQQYVNRGMEKHMHSLFSKRTVGVLSCKTGESRSIVCVDTKKTFKTPTRHSNINKKSTDSLQEQQKFALALTSSVSMKTADKNLFISQNKDNSSLKKIEPKASPAKPNTCVTSEMEKSIFSTNKSYSMTPHLQTGLKSGVPDSSKHEIFKSSLSTSMTDSASKSNESESKHELTQQSRFVPNAPKSFETSLFPNSDSSNIAANKLPLASSESSKDVFNANKLSTKSNIIFANPSSSGLFHSSSMPSTQSPLTAVKNQLSSEKSTAFTSPPVTTTAQTNVSKTISPTKWTPSASGLTTELTQANEALSSSVTIFQQPTISVSNSTFSNTSTLNKANPVLFGTGNASQVQSSANIVQSSVISNSGLTQSPATILSSSNNNDAQSPESPPSAGIHITPVTNVSEPLTSLKQTGAGLLSSSKSEHSDAVPNVSKPTSVQFNFGSTPSSNAPTIKQSATNKLPGPTLSISTSVSVSQPETNLFSSINTSGSGLFGTKSSASTQPTELPGSNIAKSNLTEQSHTRVVPNVTSASLNTQPNTVLFSSSNSITTTTQCSSSIFGTSISSNLQSTAGLILSPNKSSSQPITGLFGSPNTSNTQTSTGLFGSPNASNTQTSTGLFGSPNASNTQTSTGLFGSPNSANTQASTGLFGSPDKTNTGLFGSANVTSTQPSNSLFGSPTATTAQSSSGLFGSTITTTTQPATGLFGLANVAGTTSNTGLFGSQTATKTQSSIGLFATTNTPSTQPNSSLFGSANTTTTTQSNSGLFGSTNVSNVQPNTGLFGTASTAITQPNTGLFGSPSSSSTQSSTGLFGSPNATSTQSNTGLFGSPGSPSNQPSTGLFGSSNNSSTQQSTGLFGSVNTPSTQSSTGLFGSANNQSTQQSSGLFGSVNTPSTQPSTGLFGSTNTQPNTGLFGSANNTSTQQSTGLFGSSNATNTQSSTGLFGSANTSFTQPSTGLFGKPNAANNQPSTGLFGSSNTSSAQTTTGLFGSSNSTGTQPSTGLFGSANVTGAQPATGLFGNNAPQNQSSGLFGSNKAGGNLFNNPTSSNASGGPFGTTSSISTTDTSGGSLFGSSFMSGLGSSKSSAANTSNIFATANTNTYNAGNSPSGTNNLFASNNLFTSTNQSNNSGGLFNSSSNSGFNFGSKAQAPAQQQSSLFGSRPSFGNTNTGLVQNNNVQTSSLFSNSVFGNSNDSQMTFRDVAGGNNNQSAFGMSSNTPINPGNLFQSATSPSFTQRRM